MNSHPEWGIRDDFPNAVPHEEKVTSSGLFLKVNFIKKAMWLVKVVWRALNDGLGKQSCYTSHRIISVKLWRNLSWSS